MPQALFLPTCGICTQGPCNEPKPWGWSVVNNAKWQSWKQLGDMSSMEAMRLYVRTLEEETVSRPNECCCPRCGRLVTLEALQVPLLTELPACLPSTLCSA